MKNVSLQELKIGDWVKTDDWERPHKVTHILKSSWTRIRFDGQPTMLLKKGSGEEIFRLYNRSDNIPRWEEEDRIRKEKEKVSI